MSPTPMRFALSCYRAALRLYPRQFREDYGDDMVLLLADQLSDERPARVCARALLDLVLTIPHRYLEAHMNRSPSPAVPLFVFAIASLGTLLVVGASGSGGPFLMLFGLLGAVSAGLAVTAWSRSRPYVERQSLTANWWRWTLGGAALLGALAGVTSITGEVPEGTWPLFMGAFLAGVGMTGYGAVLGLARVFGGWRRQPA